MDWLQAFLLGILQGIAEFLPISSDGHLELGKAVLKVEGADNLLFTIVVHGATVLATVIIFCRSNPTPNTITRRRQQPSPRLPVPYCSSTA